MKMNRSSIKRLRMTRDQDDGYVEADRAELIAMVWDITKDAWSFVKGSNKDMLDAKLLMKKR